MTMPTVRTTNQPDRTIEVSDDEAADLATLGLLVTDEAPPESSNRTTTATGGK